MVFIIKTMNNNNNIYIFNPFYSLKNDKKRILLMNSPHFKIPFGFAEDGIVSFIHPLFAIILSFFDGRTPYNDVISKIATVTNFEKEDIENFVNSFIENNKRINIEYDDNYFEFPINILVNNNDKKYKKRSIDYNEFFIEDEYDFYTYRLFESPSTITILLNTKCITDCIYCYVDREKKMDCQIPITRIKELIREAKQLKVIQFDISGTEIFLYKYWDELVTELIANDYYPYLSTKIPISDKIIKRLKTIGINDIQISLDTVDNKIAQIINKVEIDNYIEKMLKTLKLLDINDINCAINVVLVKENGSVESVKKLLDSVNSFSNIERVTLNPAERSQYWDSKNYDLYKNTLSEIQLLEKFIDENKKMYNFELVLAGYTKKDEYVNKSSILKTNFDNRASCSANKEQFCILSDGQVTICEELYWTPQFIIGDINKQSIKEVWQSEKALKLEELSRSDFRDESICKICHEFENCRLGKGVCWSDVISAYGLENFDYPSPTCPYSPKLKYSFYHE